MRGVKGEQEDCQYKMCVKVLVYLHIKKALVKYLIILLARISLRNFKVDIEDIGEGEA